MAEKEILHGDEKDYTPQIVVYRDGTVRPCNTREEFKEAMEGHDDVIEVKNLEDEAKKSVE